MPNSRNRTPRDRLVPQGPGLPTELRTGLAARVRGERFPTLQDAIGTDAAESHGPR
jgi:hypothetical protein